MNGTETNLSNKEDKKSTSGGKENGLVSILCCINVVLLILVVLAIGSFCILTSLDVLTLKINGSDQTKQVQLIKSEVLEYRQKCSQIFEQCQNAKAVIPFESPDLKKNTDMQNCNGDGFQKINKSCYYVSNESSSWNFAEIYCQGLGGHLVSINNAYENEVVFNLTEKLSAADAWIGLSFLSSSYSNCNSSSVWTWVENNQTASYLNFATSEPNGCDKEQCVHFYNNNLWNDNQCKQPKKFICESL